MKIDTSRYIVFSHLGNLYEIPIDHENAASLEVALAPFIQSARRIEEEGKITEAPASSPAADSADDLAAVSVLNLSRANSSQGVDSADDLAAVSVLNLSRASKTR